MRSVAVLGGGVSGLSLAYFLRKLLPNCLNVTLIEGSNKTGGYLCSEKTNFLFEKGPRGFRPSKNGCETLALIESLGIENKLLMNDPKAANRFIFYNGKVEKVPTSFLEYLKSPLMNGVLMAALKELRVASVSSTQDESVYDFISRRFNSHIAELFIDPMMSGIFAGNIRTLSIQSCLPLLKEMEEKHGSVVKAMLSSSFVVSDRLLDGNLKSEFVKNGEKQISASFVDGIQTLTDALQKEFSQMPNTTILLNSLVSKLSYDQETNTSNISFHDRDVPLEFDHVFSTLAAPQLADILPCTVAQSKLRSIEYSSMAVINLGYKKNVVSQPGFGYLVPTIANQDILGVVYDSITFPGQNQQSNETRLTVMAGGTRYPEIVNKSTLELEDLAQRALSNHIGITTKPAEIHVGVLKNCIPQFNVGHNQLVDSIEIEMKNRMPNLTVSGYSFRGIGIADCVSRSKQIALDFEKKLSTTLEKNNS